MSPWRPTGLPTGRRGDAGHHCYLTERFVPVFSKPVGCTGAFWPALNVLGPRNRSEKTLHVRFGHRRRQQER